MNTLIMAFLSSSTSSSCPSLSHTHFPMVFESLSPCWRREREREREIEREPPRVSCRQRVCMCVLAFFSGPVFCAPSPSSSSLPIHTTDEKERKRVKLPLSLSHFQSVQLLLLLVEGALREASTDGRCVRGDGVRENLGTGNKKRRFCQL